MTAVAKLVRAKPLRLEFLLDPTRSRAGETRHVTGDISWSRYLEIDSALGHDRSGPRLYYLDGEIEIMSTSLTHEEIKTRLASLLVIFFLHMDIEIFPHGQATMKARLKKVGAEPDESWCFHRQSKVPDLVIEVALTSGGLPKLEIYRRFKIGEVWIWRKGNLEVHLLQSPKKGYLRAERSRCLPDLDLALLERCVKMKSSRQAWREFRDGRPSR